jgi:hydroxymethylbilane synthase
VSQLTFAVPVAVDRPGARQAIRIGTRGSALALAQATLVAEALQGAGAAVEIVTVETAGDRRAPDTAWGEGAFVVAIQRALLDGRVDVAVHSAKDVPTDPVDGLVIGAYLPREDPRDCLVLPAGSRATTLDELPSGARLGTDSPRRSGFLRAARHDFRPVPLHGNVDTRLRRLDEGNADALVLAVAGLTRLGRAERISFALDPLVVPPAPGQGAIAVEARVDDGATLDLLAGLDHRPTRVAVEAERAVLSAAGGGCRSPIGALGTVRGDRLRLVAGYASTDGSVADVITAEGALDDGAHLAAELVARLDRSVGIRGAGRLRPRVLVTRPQGSGDGLVAALEDRGLEAVAVPTVAIVPAPDGALDDLSDALIDADWLVVTSANAVPVVTQALERDARKRQPPRLAAVGAVTADALRAKAGVEAWTPSRATAATLADELPLDGPQTVVLATTPEADDRLADRLRARGATVHVVTAYETNVGPSESREPLRTALRSPRGIDAVAVFSGSAVRGIVALADEGELARLRGVLCLCVGPETASAARTAGFTRILVADRTDASALADLAATTLLTQNHQPGETP